MSNDERPSARLVLELGLAGATVACYPWVKRGVNAMLMLIFAIQIAAPVPKAPQGPFFPTEVGTVWVYEDNRGETTFVVTDVERRGDGSAIVSVGQTWRGRTGPSYVMLVEDGRLEEAADSPGGGFVHLGPKGPWKTWGGQTRRAAGAEVVRVPAGDFVCVRVDVTRGEYAHTAWYAPGVGEVKYATTAGPGKGYVRVLKSFP